MGSQCHQTTRDGVPCSLYLNRLVQSKLALPDSLKEHGIDSGTREVDHSNPEVLS